MNLAPRSDPHLESFRRAGDVMQSVASARSRMEFSERLLPRLQQWLGTEQAFLVLLDRQSRRPTIFGGDRDLHLRLGRVLRSQPRGLQPPAIDLEAADLKPAETLTLPLSTGALHEGALVLSRKVSFEDSEKEALAFLMEGILPHLKVLSLHEQLDHTNQQLRVAQDSLGQHERTRVLGQMAAGVAHDVRNALAPVTAFSSILLNEDGMTDRTRRYLELIHESGKDVAQILGRMRDFHTGHEKPFLQPVAIASLVEEVSELTRPQWERVSLLGGSAISLITDVADGLPMIFGDPAALREMLTNLVLNSIDALAGGGRIVIRARSVETTPVGAPRPLEQITLEVEDSGTGMDAETFRRCMDPFYTTKGSSGSGLGLSQVSRIVHDHAGRLEMSSSPGAVSRFTLSFPGVRPDALTADSLPRGRKGRTARILCIDDDAGQLHLMVQLLEHDGHDVAVAVGGRAGVEAFVGARREGAAFDVVVTDLGMPDIDGRGVAAAINTTDSNTPIIMLTGWSSDIGSELLPDVALRVLAKPVQPTLLRQAIADALS